MKKTIAILLSALMMIGMFAGCGTEKFDTSVPHSFQETEPEQPVTQIPAAPEPPAEAVLPATEAEEPPAESIQPDPVPEESIAQAVLPVAGTEEQPAGETAGMTADPGPEAAGSDELPVEFAETEEADAGQTQMLLPYAFEEEEVQRYESPAAEAAELDSTMLSVPDAAVADEAGVTAPYALEEEEAQAFDSPAAEAEAAATEVPAEQTGTQVWEPSEEDKAFAEAVSPQAFAVAMAYWDSGYGVETAPSEPVFAWDAAGWYAAWLYRTEGIDILSSETVDGFLKSLGCTELELSLSDLSEFEVPRVLRGSGGTVNYDFEWHKMRIGELLGVDVEVSVTPSASSAVDVVVTQHLNAGLQTEKTFTLTYGMSDETETGFDRVLRSVTLPEFAPETDAGLTFTWAEVEEANRLENVLSVYPAVRVYSREYSDGSETWIFRRGDKPVLVSAGPDYCSGQYQGCWFDYEMDASGVARARIGAFDRDAGSWESLNDYLLQEFRDAGALRLDRIEDDLIWADCIYSGGYRQKVAFDRGTLVLREVLVLSETGEVIGSNCYDYSTEAPAFAFLNSWDGDLRKVTVTWESYEGGIEDRYTETVEIPSDWEYLPYEGRWGNYTIYNNDRYVGEYEYPGDGLDYELFLTTAKG